MSLFEFNKILASIILAIIVFVIIGILGNFLVKIDNNSNQKTAYKIDLPEESSKTTSQSEKTTVTAEPISTLLASASLEKGEKVFKKCVTCHNYQKNSKSKVGPNLWDIINKPKAGVDGFAYSKALVDFGGDWTYEELNNFLYKPKEYIEGTKMNFAGLKKVEDRANLILWLREQSDNPVNLP